MPSDLFPASRDMAGGKRKRGDDRSENQKINSEVHAGKEGEMAMDEEVEEFYAILRRLHTATKYLKNIDGASHLLMGTRSDPSSEVKAGAEEADEVKVGGEKTLELGKERSLGLDLNLEPPAIESDDDQMRRSQSQHPINQSSLPSADSHK